MKVQKQINAEQWEDVRVVIGENNHFITIEPDQYIHLNQIWDFYGGYNTAEEGMFGVYAALVDSGGNIIKTDSGDLLDIHEFEVKIKR